MLLFGDLHINWHIVDKVIGNMKDRISMNSQEKNLIFLGDYVYHFSYDREALLKLYNFFLDNYRQGKNVYILAWNHDRLWNTFVFEEAKRTYEIIKNIFADDWKNWKIEFITQPKIENIEWENILFLPYCLELDGGVSFSQDNEVPSWVIPQSNNSDFHKGAQLIEIENTIKTLSNSKNKNERFSAGLNELLLKYYKQYGKMTVVHHYYTEWLNFPWQKWKFRFSDVALSKNFCDIEWLKLISWHLHQWFAYKNYLCVWSARNTSPLEINQIKIFFKYSWDKLEWKIYCVNPYFQLENTWNENAIIDENFMQNLRESIVNQNISNYKNSDFDIQIQPEYELKNKDISLSLKVDNINYDEIYSYIDEQLFKDLKDVKLKKNFVQTEALFEKMDIEWKNLTAWFSDWKNLLKNYISVKYPADYDKYIEFLQKEKIL